MTSFLIGAQLYSVRNHTQTPEELLNTLKALKDMGYSSVQMSGQGADIPAEQIAEFIQETGQVIPATHVSIDLLENHFEDMVKRHKMWNCPYPGLGAMPREYAGSAEGMKEFALRMDKIARKLKDEGLQFVYHNHAFEFAKFDGVIGYQILLDNVSEAVQFEMDTYWVQAGGADPVEWIDKLKGRMDVVHFKDMVGSLPGPTMAPAGEGNINWKKVFEACERIGVKYAFIEQDNAVESGNSLECMRTSINNLKAIGGKF